MRFSNQLLFARAALIGLYIWQAYTKLVLCWKRAVPQLAGFTNTTNSRMAKERPCNKHFARARK
ncbi:hypothetical protein BT63DRAFT_423565 [Microthyrium microscopicum]|uniref:Uncharacterized protein n=1 Tax=Microthyrium microscopicum TaxID=703497 RepID=A0A6A6UKE0_9PEZI|nr:hypothetical protein BT63DRAFT_423565 [Microthyrium microscopicum]